MEIRKSQGSTSFFWSAENWTLHRYDRLFVFLGAGEKRPDNWTLRALLGEASGIVWKRDKREGRGGHRVQRASDKSRVKLGGSPTYNGEPPHIKRRSTAVIDQMPSLSPVFSLFSLYQRQEMPQYLPKLIQRKMWKSQHFNVKSKVALFSSDPAFQAGY